MVERNMVPAQLALRTVIVLWATISFHGVYSDCTVSHHLFPWGVQRLYCEPPSHYMVCTEIVLWATISPSWCVQRLYWATISPSCVQRSCCEPPSHLHVYSDCAVSHHLTPWCVQRWCCEPPSPWYVQRWYCELPSPWCVQWLCCEPSQWCVCPVIMPWTISMMCIYSDHATSHHHLIGYWWLKKKLLCGSVLILKACRLWRNSPLSHTSIHPQSSGAVWKSRWPSWAPIPNKPTVSVDVKQHFNHPSIHPPTHKPLKEPSYWPTFILHQNNMIMETQRIIVHSGVAEGGVHLISLQTTGVNLIYGVNRI